MELRRGRRTPTGLSIEPSAARAGSGQPFTKVPKLGKSGALSELSGADLRVLVAICEHLPNSFPSVATLARITGLSGRAVHGARQRLKAHGLIQWSKPSAARRSCRYSVNFNAPTLPVAGELQFTQPMNASASEPGTTVHLPADQSFTRSKARQRENLNDTRQQGPSVGTAARESRSIGHGSSIPDATPSELAATGDALRTFGVKSPTVARLIAFHPYLRAETVHILWPLVRQRRAKNPPGLLVQLIREEGLRVTAELLARNASAIETEATPPTSVDGVAASAPSDAPSRGTEPDPDNVQRLRDNVARRDECRAALAATEDPSARAQIEAELSDLRTVGASLGAP